MQMPISTCSLSPAEHVRRRADYAVLTSRALLARARTAGGARLTFRDSDETERELHALIAAEASCCPFLRMDLQRTDGGLVLDVAGAADAQPIVEAFLA